jgi:hypothetical protein
MIMQLKIWLFKQLYKSIAKHGREGDTELAHVNSYEVELLRLVGGSGTINPTLQDCKSLKEAEEHKQHHLN